jgi:hypothetical protein
MAILTDVLYDPDPDGQGGGSSSDGGNNTDDTPEFVIDNVLTEEVSVSESTNQ